MKCLYAPWRSNYTESAERTKQDDTTAQECVFCSYIHDNQDEKHFLIKRFASSCILLNRYPYNAGHLLIIPYDHIGTMEHLSKATRSEMMEAANAATQVLQQTARPHGFNVGFNIGKAAGGSIPTHIHLHVIPRWIGDTNFLPAISETKVISMDLMKIYEDLRHHFENVTL